MSFQLGFSSSLTHPQTHTLYLTPTDHVYQKLILQSYELDDGNRVMSAFLHIGEGLVGVREGGDLLIGAGVCPSIYLPLDILTAPTDIVEIYLILAIITFTHSRLYANFAFFSTLLYSYLCLLLNYD